MGRGPFTFLPSIYRTLDNQYLGSMVEGGIIGLAALVLLLAGTAFAGLALARRVPPGPDRALSRALAAGCGIALLMFSTFDAFSFPMAMGVFFVLVGLTGAAHRAMVDPVPAPVDRSVRLRWGGRLVVGAVVLVILAVGALSLRAAQPAYDARGSLALAVPPVDGQNIYWGKLDIGGVSDVVERVVTSDATRRELRAAGFGSYQVALGVGSLAPWTEVHGSGDVVSISAVSTDPGAAAATTTAVLREIEDELARLQSGITPRYQVAVVDSFSAPEVFVMPVRPLWGAPALVLVAGLLGGLVRALMLSGARGGSVPRLLRGLVGSPQDVGPRPAGV